MKNHIKSLEDRLAKFKKNYEKSYHTDEEEDNTSKRVTI